MANDLAYDQLGNPIPNDLLKFLIENQINPSDIRDIDEIEALIIIYEHASAADPRWTVGELLKQEIESGYAWWERN